MLVCAKCNQALRPKTNGTCFIELAGDRPYKLWSADLWECQQCGAEVLYTSDLQQPIAHHFEKDFNSKLESYAPAHQSKEWTRGNT